MIGSSKGLKRIERGGWLKVSLFRKQWPQIGNIKGACTFECIMKCIIRIHRALTNITCFLPVSHVILILLVEGTGNCVLLVT